MCRRLGSVWRGEPPAAFMVGKLLREAEASDQSSSSWDRSWWREAAGGGPQGQAHRPRRLGLRFPGLGGKEAPACGPCVGIGRGSLATHRGGLPSAPRDPKEGHG